MIQWARLRAAPRGAGSRAKSSIGVSPALCSRNDGSHLRLAPREVRLRASDRRPWRKSGARLDALHDGRCAPRVRGAHRLDASFAHVCHVARELARLYSALSIMLHLL